MSPTSVTTQHVTNASGTVAIASTSTSITTQRIVSDAPASAEQLIYTANQVISTADYIAIASCSILLVSFFWSIYSGKKKQRIDEKFYILRREELELEKARFRREHSNL